MLDKATDKRAEAIDSVVYRMFNYNKIKTMTFDNDKEEVMRT